MELILRDKACTILSLAPGEDVVAELTKWCEKEAIQAGSLTAIGAVREVELAWYDVDEKKYTTRTFDEKLEIASLLGNVSMLDGDLVVHAHGVFSGKDFQAIGGHVNRAVVGAACEVTLRPSDGEMVRNYSQKLGLNILRQK